MNVVKVVWGLEIKSMSVNFFEGNMEGFRKVVVYEEWGVF